MEQQKKAKGTRAKDFFKRNIYFILMGVCILAVGAMITVTAINQKRQNSTPVISDVVDDPLPDTSNKDGNGEPSAQQPETPAITEVVFAQPVEGEVINDYSETALVLNKTTKDWRVHQGIDYSAPAGTEVKAVYDGTVTAITTTTMRGTAITISHGNNLESRYYLLDNDVSVKLNQAVKKGDVIGKVGSSGIFEIADGTHLHFEAAKEGKLVDPNNYFAGENK